MSGYVALCCNDVVVLDVVPPEIIPLACGGSSVGCSLGMLVARFQFCQSHSVNTNVSLLVLLLLFLLSHR